jgi:hypothetical protein
MWTLSPFTEATRRGRVTSWPLAKVAWQSKSVPGWASTLPAQSTDFAAGRSVSFCARNVCAVETEFEWSTVVVPPTDTEPEHPATRAGRTNIATSGSRNLTEATLPTARAANLPPARRRDRCDRVSSRVATHFCFARKAEAAALFTGSSGQERWDGVSAGAVPRHKEHRDEGNRDSDREPKPKACAERPRQDRQHEPERWNKERGVSTQAHKSSVGSVGDAKK